MMIVKKRKKTIPDHTCDMDVAGVCMNQIGSEDPYRLQKPDLLIAGDGNNLCPETDSISSTMISRKLGAIRVDCQTRAAPFSVFYCLTTTKRAKNTPSTTRQIAFLIVSR